MPRPAFTPKSRAEAIAAPLADVRQAATEDRRYLHGLAVIVADLLAPAAATDVKDPAEPQTADRVRRDWQQAQQAATRETRIHV